MNNFEHRVLRIEPINTAVQRCASRTFPWYRPSCSLEQIRTQGFLPIESTAAIQRCARKSIEFASGSNIVGQNRVEMENSLVTTQDSTHVGFCCTFPLRACVDRPSRSPHVQFRTQGSAHNALLIILLLYKGVLNSTSTEFASR